MCVFWTCFDDLKKFGLLFIVCKHKHALLHCRLEQADYFDHRHTQDPSYIRFLV